VRKRIVESLLTELTWDSGLLLKVALGHASFPEKMVKSKWKKLAEEIKKEAHGR
jgi:hypothetical protein